MTVQIPVLGVAPGLLAASAEGGFAFEDPADGGPVPVMLSRRLIEVYNKTIAPSWNVRKLPMGLSLVGLQLPVKVGYSIVPQKPEERIFDARLRLVGLSDRVPLYMLAMPLATVQRLNREYGKPDTGFTLRAELNNFDPYSFNIERRLHGEGRDVDPLTTIETERRNSQVMGMLSARWTFS